MTTKKLASFQENLKFNDLIDKSFVISAKFHQTRFRQVSGYEVSFESILTFSKPNEQIKIKHELLK